MAVPSNTLLTTGGSAVVGMREDLSEIVVQIGREERPFMSWCGTGKATNTLAHSWETVALRTPSATNHKAEGDTFAATAAKLAVKLTNCCQILAEVAFVSGSTEAVDVAGQLGKLDKQVMIKSLEAMRDEEASLVGNNAINTADPRLMASIQTWCGTSDVNGGTAPTANGVTAYVAGTLRDLSITTLNTLIRAAWQNGCKTGVMFMPSNEKLNFDAIIPDQQQLSTSFANTEKDGAMLVSTVSIWRSAFGDIRIVMDHVMDTVAADQVLGFDERGEYRPKVCPLPGRDWQRIPLAKTGDNIQAAVLAEVTLEVPNPKGAWLLGSLN